MAFISALGEHVGTGEISVAAVVGAAGGAGAAICDSLCKLDLRKLHLYDLAREQMVALAEMLNQAYPTVEVRLESDVRFAEADIVVNCSPLGMRPDDPLPFAVETLKSTAVVADLVTSVEITPVLEAARKRGLIIRREGKWLPPRSVGNSRISVGARRYIAHEDVDCDGIDQRGFAREAGGDCRCRV